MDGMTDHTTSNNKDDKETSSADNSTNVVDLKQEIAELKLALDNEKEKSEVLKSRLRSVLWDYIPRQRKVVDIPPDTGLVRLGPTLEITDYELKNLIGAGSFGSVFAAQYQKNGENVAIKIIDLDQQLRLGDVIALEQEIRAMKVLTHPNLVRLTEVIRGRRHICLVMNLVAGGNCFQLVQQHFPLPFTEIRKVFTGIVAGVNAMHQRGFVHRDIKPENILLNESNEAVIADLGLCTKTTPGTSIREVVGTNGFMAPELGSGRPFEPMPADIFSVGCTLLELVYGNGTVRPLVDITRGNAAEKMSELQKSVIEKSASRIAVSTTQDNEECLDFVACSLRLDPKLRIPAPRALDHPFIAVMVPIRNRLGTAGSDSTTLTSADSGRRGWRGSSRGSSSARGTSSSRGGGTPLTGTTPKPGQPNTSRDRSSSRMFNRSQSGQDLYSHFSRFPAEPYSPLSPPAMFSSTRPSTVNGPPLSPSVSHFPKVSTPNGTPTASRKHYQR